MSRMPREVNKHVGSTQADPTLVCHLFTFIGALHADCRRKLGPGDESKNLQTAKPVWGKTRGKMAKVLMQGTNWDFPVAGSSTAVFELVHMSIHR